ncbi:MAG: VOC family protein [Lentilactobacillus diolivorans]|uniref:VOC family protein n=1 Tax=Lentilactobacillus diolivorans TaxID=179838 RepID=UPI0039EB3C9B
MKILKSYTRVYVHHLNATLNRYQQLLSTTVESRFKYPQKGLELASIGNLLLISGDEDSLRPFRTTQITFLVDDLDEFVVFFKQHHFQIIHPYQHVPTGKNITVKDPEGFIAEYVQHV